MDAASLRFSVNHFNKQLYMKKIMLAFMLCFFMNNAFAQNETAKEIQLIKVPDFADAEVKSFYQSYADHLIKCIKAIREKNEAKTMALFKNPGEHLVAREKIISKEIVKNTVEKEKYAQFAAQVYPYIKELENSECYKKMYSK
jgi:hypothetical protein